MIFKYKISCGVSIKIKFDMVLGQFVPPVIVGNLLFSITQSFKNILAFLKIKKKNNHKKRASCAVNLIGCMPTELPLFE